jgi:ankyrin repeat protein
VEQVLSFNPDVNARDTHGRTALIEAVGENRHIVRLLLDRGADPNLDDERGNTALIGCAWDADAALALIKHGANVNIQNKEGHESADKCGGTRGRSRPHRQRSRCILAGQREKNGT